MHLFLKSLVFLLLLQVNIAQAQEKSQSGEKDETTAKSNQVRILETEYIKDGFSFGLVAFSHNYNINAEILLNGTTKKDLSSRSGDFYSIGAVGRYAKVPIEEIGVDTNLTLASSTNHSDNGFSPIMTARIELNLSYARWLTKNIPYYFLLGFGSELIKGSDIEHILATSAETYQITFGTELIKNFSFEIEYLFSSHGLGKDFKVAARSDALANGATSARIDSNDGRVVSNIISGRIVYSY